MTYVAATSDDSRSAENRLYPKNQSCLKLSVSTTAAYKMLSRDVKSCVMYCPVACWVRIDKVVADPTAARDLSDTTADNVLYVPAGSFLLAQETEFNCVSIKTAGGSDTAYLYPAYGVNTTGLIAEDLQA